MTDALLDPLEIAQDCLLQAGIAREMGAEGDAASLERAAEVLQALVGRLRQREQERDHERANSRAILRKYEGALADADRAEAALRKLYDVAFDLWSHEAVGTHPWAVLGQTLAEIKPVGGVGSPTGAPQP